ncbi:uncharacterized protein LOC127280716 [Leptopilina boulardi]|uniref:uncharacterized protein LOC127280716 n=1 Tax=Leptopilina boulardi TaxID=63433 RepID=UPI0021F5E203|nr:uncharacterized protein LOC127280716 [Leptopilina boulardi]
MNNKVEYLEKYSVAPSPNRDYYGIKVHCDEIILFLWKISHGPHRTPAIRVSKFSEFNSDKILQDEIERIFGNYLLEHVRNISQKTLSLLTLPKYIIARVTKYLKIKDILNLSTLSHASKEVFDSEIIWELMYKKFIKSSKNNVQVKKLSMSSNWKQLLKEKQLEESVKNRMSCAKNLTNQIKIDEKLLKKSSLNTVANFEKKISLKLDSDIKLNSTIIVDETKKKILSNQIQMISKGKDSKLNRSQFIDKNKILEKKQKTNLKIKSIENINSKTNIINQKLKSNQSDEKLDNKKLILNSKYRKEKQKIISESKLKIYTDDNLFEFNNDNFSSLIKENLQKMKSPRGIFNYDFSVL